MSLRYHPTWNNHPLNQIMSLRYHPTWEPSIKPDVCLCDIIQLGNITGWVVKHLSHKVPSTVPSNHLSLASQRVKLTLIGFNIIVITETNDSFKLKHRKIALQSTSVILTQEGSAPMGDVVAEWLKLDGWRKTIILEKLNNYCVKTNLGVGLMPASLSSAYV